MNRKLFDRYGYSAFISYATEDDRSRNAWVSCFADELDLALPGRVRGLKLRDVYVPAVHLSGDKPLLAGRLSDLLLANIENSFAMFLFVHDNYNLSDWCLKELEYFKTLFKEDGFKTRLYVIAMSQSALDELMKGETWKRLCPFEDQLWIGFYREDAPDHPLTIYSGQGRNKRTVIDDDFWKKFSPLLDDFAAKIFDVAQPRPSTYPTADTARTLALPQDKHLVRVYIESSPDQKQQQESLGLEIETSWDRVVDALHIEPRLYLRPSGLAMTDIAQRPRLDDADGVVLLWSKKTPAAVAAQIKIVEPKLIGPKPAPGLVAYVMQEADDLPDGMSIGNWNVVRFRADASGSVTVLADDVPVLEGFLRNVLARKDPNYLRV